MGWGGAGEGEGDHALRRKLRASACHSLTLCSAGRRAAAAQSGCVPCAGNRLLLTPSPSSTPLLTERQALVCRDLHELERWLQAGGVGPPHEVHGRGYGCNPLRSREGAGQRMHHRRSGRRLRSRRQACAHVSPAGTAGPPCKLHPARHLRTLAAPVPSSRPTRFSSSPPHAPPSLPTPLPPPHPATTSWLLPCAARLPHLQMDRVGDEFTRALHAPPSVLLRPQPLVLGVPNLELPPERIGERGGGGAVLLSARSGSLRFGGVGRIPRPVGGWVARR